MPFFSFQFSTAEELRAEIYLLFFILGLFGVTIYHISLNTGEMYISSGVASLIIAISPIFVLFFSWMYLNEKINRWKVFGTLIAFSGIALTSEPSYANIFGIMLTLISAIASSVYITLGKKLMEKYDPLTLTSNAMLLGSIPLIFFLPSSVMEILNVSEIYLVTSIIFLGIESLKNNFN